MRVYMIYRSLFFFLNYIIIIYGLLARHELAVDCRLSSSLSTIARAVDYFCGRFYAVFRGGDFYAAVPAVGRGKLGALLSSGIGAGGRAAARPAGIWQRRRGGNNPRIYCGGVVVYSLHAKLATYKRV